MRIYRQTKSSASFNINIFSGGGADDVYRLGQCLLLTKQYHRAASLVMKNNLHLDHLGCCYVAAKAQFHVNEVQVMSDLIILVEALFSYL